MGKLNNLKNSMSVKMGDTKLKIKKYSPEIAFGLGVISFGCTLITVVKNSKKAEKVLEDHKASLDIVEECVMQVCEGEMDASEYTKKDEIKEKIGIYAWTSGRLILSYAPTIALSTLSLACFFQAYNINKKRYLGAVAAFNGLNAAFQAYRKRVIDEEGEDADRHFMYGTERIKIDVSETDENGKTKKHKEEIENTDAANLIESCNGRIFDESNPNWDENQNFTMMFLNSQESILNDILHTRGHVFLNEVLDALGFNQTSEGAVVGWFGKDHTIDFGLYDIRKNRRFINGDDKAIYLNFNHDGVIFEQI